MKIGNPSNAQRAANENRNLFDKYSAIHRDAKR